MRIGSTPAGTPTSTATDTATETPTVTPTPTNTATASPAWIYCAAEGGTCNHPGNRTVRYISDDGRFRTLAVIGTSIPCNNTTFGDPAPGVVKHCDYSSDPLPPVLTSTPTSTPTVTATYSGASCGTAAPSPHVLINPGTDFEEVVSYSQNNGGITPSDPPLCRDNTINGGGCPLRQAIDGSSVAIIDGSRSTDNRACTPEDANLSYHWQIFYPPSLQSGVYTAQGITGYRSPILTIQPNSLPNQDNRGNVDKYWRAVLTITANPNPGEAMTPAPTVAYFRFLYDASDLTLSMSTTCQAATQAGPTLPCKIWAALPAPPSTT